MSLRSNFKFHECDKRKILRRAYAIVSPIAAGFDLLENGRPVILLRNDRDERFPSETIANQIKTVAYHSREAMVRTCLDVCGILSQPSNGKKLLVNGCYFLRLAIDDVWKRLHHFPENPAFDNLLEDIPKRPPTFYDTSFWSSSIVQSWLIVHTVYEWYALCMPRWASSEADKLVNRGF